MVGQKIKPLVMQSLKIYKGQLVMMIECRRSLIRVPEKQKRIVHSLGLRRIGQVRDIKDNQCTRGMVKKVSHLVAILEAF